MHITVYGASPSAQPGQMITLAATTYITTGPTVTSPCLLTLTEQGQQTPALSQSISFPPMLWRIVLPTTLMPGSYSLVCSSNGAASNTVAINIGLGPPGVTTFTPWFVGVGTDGTVTISGSGFEQSQGNGYVHLIGAGVPDVYVSQISVWSNTQIIFTVPGYAAVGQYQLVVHTDSNGDSMPYDGFLVVPHVVQTSSGTGIDDAPPPPPAPIPLFGISDNTPLVTMFVAGPCVVSPSGVNKATAYGFNTNFWDGFGNGCANHIQQLQFNQNVPSETITVAGQFFSFPTISVPSPALSIPIKLLFVDQTSLHGFQPGTAQGDHGHFEATIQQWVPEDPGGMSPPGGQGHWQPVNDPAGLLSNLAWNVPSSGANQTNTQIEHLNLQLTGVDEFLRIGVYYNEPVDTRIATKIPNSPELGSNDGSNPPWQGPYENPGCLTIGLTHPLPCAATGQPNAGAAPDSTIPGNAVMPPCDSTTGQSASANGMCVGTGPTHAAGTGTWVYNVQTGILSELPPTNTWIYGPPFRMILQPTSEIQAKVLPYTLLYMPPGEKSSQSFTISQNSTTTYGFTTTFGSGTSAGVTYGDEQSLGGATPTSFNGIPLPTYSQTNSSAWSLATNAVQGNSTGAGVSYSLGEINSSGIAVNEPYTKSGGEPVPSANASYYLTQPFWKDQFYLLVHPKFSVYNLSRCTSGMMPPCNDGKGVTNQIINVLAGADTIPATPTVLQLYQCLAPGGSFPLPAEPETDSNGNIVLDPNGNTVYDKPDAMTPFDCSQVLQDDPFFAGMGQSTVLNPQATTVSLITASNRLGIVYDGTTFGGGLDNDGNAYSWQLLGPQYSALGAATITVDGVPYALGSNAPGFPNTVTSTQVPLPAGHFTTLKMLAVAVNGNQPGQSFRVTFADGTTQAFTQSLSDWFTPQNFQGETTALTTTYRDMSNGKKDSRTFLLYSYSFVLDSSKIVASLSLPNNPNVVVIAITLLSPKASQVDIYKSSLPPGPGFGPAGSYTLSNGQILGWSASLTNTESFQTTVQDAVINSLVQKEAVPYGVIAWTQRLITGEVNGISLTASYGSSTNSAISTLQNVSTTFRDDDFSYYTDSFDDPNADPSVIQVWTDNSFGTYMFRMPNAATGPTAGRFPPPVVCSISQNADCNGKSLPNTVTINGQNLFAATQVAFNYTGIGGWPHIVVAERIVPASPATSNTCFSVPAPTPLPRGLVFTSVSVLTPNGVSASVRF